MVVRSHPTRSIGSVGSTASIGGVGRIGYIGDAPILDFLLRSFGLTS